MGIGMRKGKGNAERETRSAEQEGRGGRNARPEFCFLSCESSFLIPASCLLFPSFRLRTMDSGLFSRFLRAMIY